MQLQRALPARDRPAQPVAVSPADGAADLLPLNPGLGSPPNRDAAWRPTSVPAGWEPVSVACLSLHLGLPDLVRRITDCIYEEIPSYQQNRIARADLEASVAANTDATLIGVAARREPSAEELEWRFRLGRKRAEQGMPAEDVVKAFHIAHRELWEELVTAAVADPAATDVLLAAATDVWSWTYQLTSAVCDGHKDHTHSRSLVAVRRAARLIELIRTSGAGSEEAALLARTFGFDPEGIFGAALIRGSGDVAIEAHRCQQAMAGQFRAAVCVPWGTDLVVLAQRHLTELSELESAVRAAVPGATVALGLDRIGLPGARLSIADAERTLAVTTPAATGRYSELWFLAALKRDGETVPAILQRGIRVVQERPHLAAAVRALLDCGFSHQRAGRRLCVHPNTVAYRVERWRELTGWEIGRSQGLRLTMAALAWTEGETVNADPRPGSL
ncbi:MAG: hypothetical protein E6I63_01665 [Chloroflexi bacterium]|nr:MAG: hypothetical protein E6I63_01665 [Chloroflexota bacterium]